MAPHGRPKLKRPPRVGALDLSKATASKESTRPASTSRRKSTAEGASEPRVKTPTSEERATAELPESPKVKSPVNEDRASPDPNCPICLGKLKNKSFTDSCLHQFCFKCLVQWSKVKPECPLCKQAFKSIIHNVRSNEDYDQYHCDQPPPRDPFIDYLFSFPGFSRFRYRTTQVSGSRRGDYNETTVHELTLHEDLPFVLPNTPGWEGRPARIASTTIRANIYNQDLWIQGQPDVTGRYRECSPEFYRTHPAQIHRLVPWLTREIPSVSRANIPHMQVIIDIILSLIQHHHIQSRVMYSRLRPFFGARTTHFLHEFHAFARSPFDLVGFDHALVYGPNPNPTVYTPDGDEVLPFSDSDDSDVIILESGVEPVAGPSGIRRTRPLSIVVPVQPGSSQSTTTSNLESPLIVDDSDDCEIVDYVKPRHERTPEIIVLSDTDEEAGDGRNGANEDGNNLWHRMQQVHESLTAISDILSPITPSPDSPFSISESSSSSSTSEYKPYTLRSSSKKSTAKKCKKKKSKSCHTKVKSSKKPVKMRAQPTFSDSDEDDILRRSSKSKRHTKSTKERSRRVTRVLCSPSSSGSEGIYLRDTSRLERNTFSSQNSVNDCIKSNLLKQDSRSDGSNASGTVMWPSSSEETEFKPGIITYPVPVFPGFTSPPQSPLPQYENEEPVNFPDPPRDTWCVKPSTSNRDDTSDDGSSQCSSGSEFRPKLKSIVIMRTNNSNCNTRARSPPTSRKGLFKRESHSPVASTSRAELQPSTTSLSFRPHSLSPSRHSHSTSSFSERTSHYNSKCKKFNKRVERRSTTRSDSRSRSDSDSNWERKIKRPRISKWQFNESSDDSSY